MCTGIGAVMSRTTASDPWEIGKAFLRVVRLRTGKGFL